MEPNRHNGTNIFLSFAVQALRWQAFFFRVGNGSPLFQPVAEGEEGVKEFDWEDDGIGRCFQTHCTKKHFETLETDDQGLSLQLDT